jgi:hypothetical protein
MDIPDLIRTKRAGRSFAELSRDGDGVPSPQRWQQLASLPPKTFPEPPAIRGIARTLRVTEWTVIRCAAEGLGLGSDRPESRLIAAMPAGTEELSEEECTVVWAVVDALLAARRAAAPQRPVKSVRRSR